MDPPEEKRTNEEISAQLQTSIQNKDVTLLQEILRKNKVVKDVLVRCKRLRSHQTRVFGYHDDAVDAVQYTAYIGDAGRAHCAAPSRVPHGHQGAHHQVDSAALRSVRRTSGRAGAAGVRGR